MRSWRDWSWADGNFWDSGVQPLEVLEKLPKGRVKLATRVFNQNDEQVVDGEAEVLAPRSEQTLEMPALPPVTIG